MDGKEAGPMKGRKRSKENGWLEFKQDSKKKSEEMGGYGNRRETRNDDRREEREGRDGGRQVGTDTRRKEGWKEKKE